MGTHANDVSITRATNLLPPPSPPQQQRQQNHHHQDHNPGTTTTSNNTTNTWWWWWPGGLRVVQGYPVGESLLARKLGDAPPRHHRHQSPPRPATPLPPPPPPTLPTTSFLGCVAVLAQKKCWSLCGLTYLPQHPGAEGGDASAWPMKNWMLLVASVPPKISRLSGKYMLSWCDMCFFCS